MTASPSFEAFPARAYLEKYYAHVGVENAGLLGALTAFGDELRPRLGAVVEVGGGPIVLPLLALTATAGRAPERVVFTDIAPANLNEVERWLFDAPDQFDYRDTLAWLADAVGADPAGVVAALRACRWHLRPTDMRAPVPGELLGAFDTVSSHFFADSATDREEELVEFLAKMRRMAAPGATFFLSFMCRSRGYRVDGTGFPAVTLDPDSIPFHLARAGLRLERFRMRTVASEDAVGARDYAGLIFVAGELPG